MKTFSQVVKYVANNYAGHTIEAKKHILNDIKKK